MRAQRERDPFDVFVDFVELFCRRFKDPGLLDGVDAKESHRDYVFRYFARTFTEATEFLPRHLKWYRRLEPVLALPRGATILDYGGGYGMDTAFLAACGYNPTLLEISPHHIAIARRFAHEAARVLGAAEPGFVRTTPSARDLPASIGEHDAVILHEVAHHIEPPDALFRRCGAALRRGGSLFLLEPSFWNPIIQAYFLKVRRLRLTVAALDEETGAPYLYGNEHIRTRRRWEAHARGADLAALRRTWICALGQRSRERGALRRLAESVPIVRDLAASHVTIQFVRP